MTVAPVREDVGSRRAERGRAAVRPLPGHGLAGGWSAVGDLAAPEASPRAPSGVRGAPDGAGVGSLPPGATGTSAEVSPVPGHQRPHPQCCEPEAPCL